jgi:phage-related protein
LEKFILITFNKEGKVNDESGWIQPWYIVRKFTNVTMHSQCNSNNKQLSKIKKKHTWDTIHLDSQLGFSC